MKKWIINNRIAPGDCIDSDKIIKIILSGRGLDNEAKIDEYLNIRDPKKYSPKEVGLDMSALKNAVTRIRKALTDNESIIVYGDYDADGITATAIMWQALHNLGAKVMPYIPHRVEEGYGLSQKGIDLVNEKWGPGLIITVDQGVTGRQKVAYAQSLGIDVIVTDHHALPEKLPECIIVHSTLIAGSAVSWFTANYLYRELSKELDHGLLALAAIGSVSDMMPLTGVNRSLVKYGLSILSVYPGVGLAALIAQAGLNPEHIGVYEISYILAPRLNAMGRLEHAIDALRLLCTKDKLKAQLLAHKLSNINSQRQQLTIDSTTHALEYIRSTIDNPQQKKIFVVSGVQYNQGIIGLVAGKLVEEYYRPAIVISEGEKFSKASARSITGFNIIQALRGLGDLLVEVGGHPMAAGFTIETDRISLLKEKLEILAENMIADDMLVRSLAVDIELPLTYCSLDLWNKIQELSPFGFGNPEPVLVTTGVRVADIKPVGAAGKHLKLKIVDPSFARPDPDSAGIAGSWSVAGITYEAIAFNQGEMYGEISANRKIDIAYSLDLNDWNGNQKLQLKIKDIRISSSDSQK